jgi:protein-tyrosine phosphatase
MTHIPFEGTPNFRDFGGHETQTGQSVRKRLLFRSSHLASLTDADLDRVADLNLSTVIDLRMDDERVKDPTRLPAQHNILILHMGMSGRREKEPSRVDTWRENPSISAAEVSETIESAYETFVLYRQSELAGVFKALLQDNGAPALIHCAAGKDRTGVACALVLSALGVARETVFADYVLTNRYLGPDYRAQRMAAIFPANMDVAPDVADALFDAREPYLLAAFAAIDREYGSLDDYLKQALNVGPAERDGLRLAFTE